MQQKAIVLAISQITKAIMSASPQNKVREDLVERVKWNVNRDSPEDKLRDFMDWMKAVKKETIHHVCVCVCVWRGGEGDCVRGWSTWI